MKSLLLILMPMLGSVVAALMTDNRRRPWLLPVVGSVQMIMVGWAMTGEAGGGVGTGTSEWVGYDALARAVMPMVTILFWVCSIYGVSYLRMRSERPNRLFVALFLAMLGLLSAGLQARHLGVLWIATEAVTLTAVPLLHFNGTPRAFEATWKYLIVGGTGVALSLLGSFCLGYASLHGGGQGDLTFVSLMAQGRGLSRPWVLVAWVLLLVGYGTKMGLAPMHTWKPDAYGEAPGIVAAMLAGGVTTLAFTAILRVRAVVGAAGEGAMADRTLLAVGVFSMVVAGLFLLGTRDFKRMLAYSSVEHMGVLSVGAALGPAGVGAALFHVWTNGITKGALFLSAGNIRRAAGSASMDAVRGMLDRTPRSAAMFVIGLFAVTAMPPFGVFLSELQVIRAMGGEGRWVTMGLFLVSLLMAFVGMTRVVFGIVDGPTRVATKGGSERFRESLGVVLPPLILLILSLGLGLWTPSVLHETWIHAVSELFPEVGGTR